MAKNRTAKLVDTLKTPRTVLNIEITLKIAESAKSGGADSKWRLLEIFQGEQLIENLKLATILPVSGCSVLTVFSTAQEPNPMMAAYSLNMHMKLKDIERARLGR